MSMRSAASCFHPRHRKDVPRGARIPAVIEFMVTQGLRAGGIWGPSWPGSIRRYLVALIQADSLPHSHVNVIDTGVVRNLSVIGDVEDDQIGALIDFERSNALRAVQSTSAVEGGGYQRFRGSHGELRAGKGHNSLHAV